MTRAGAEGTSVEVCADWEGLGGPTIMGRLHVTMARGKEIFSFEYDGKWLATHAKATTRGVALDPALRLSPGPQFVAAGRENFGVFLDSSPDRWGRVLMQRREAHRARTDARKERRLRELDYLLGVHDGHRMGALRFRWRSPMSQGTEPAGPFLDDDTELASPPWTSLRELERASLALEKVGAETSASYGKWLRMLIAPGRSLGGARPKASVLDGEGNLWIAKFPRANDREDIGAWERVVAVLARRCDVQMAESRCQRLVGRQHTFLTKRFDRADGAGRLHFASAMTLLERRDGEAGASYLDLAAFITRHGATPADLEQLWRRIVFFQCVSNVDDHLRNHGFLLGPKGWSLAPAYDVNPVATGEGLTLNISETDNAQDLDLARDVARYFRVNARRAAVIIDEVVTAVGRWRKEAAAVGIGRSEQDDMAPAFRLAES